MAEPQVTLTPVDMREEERRRRGQFHGGTAEAPGMTRLTAAGRNAMLDIWAGQGNPGRPDAVKPLRGGLKLMGLAPCGKEEEGRLLLRWSRGGAEVTVNLRALLPLFDVRIPRGHLMDVKMYGHTDPTYGEVLLCNLGAAPFRAKGHRTSAAKGGAPPAELGKEGTEGKDGQTGGPAH